MLYISKACSPFEWTSNMPPLLQGRRLVRLLWISIAMHLSFCICLQKNKGKGLAVGPVLLGFFLFVVVGSGKPTLWHCLQTGNALHHSACMYSDFPGLHLCHMEFHALHWSGWIAPATSILPYVWLGLSAGWYSIDCMQIWNWPCICSSFTDHTNSHRRK